MNPALAVHVGAGGLGLVAGAVALAARKGGRTHRRSGAVFLFAMTAMGSAAAALSVLLPDWSNLPGALFVIYLLATGWAALKRTAGWRRPFDVVALLWALGSAGLAAAFAWLASQSPNGLFAGKPAPQFGVFAALALLAAALDLRRMARPDSDQGRGRVARHVWRLCTALFFASGSFFLGQQKVMPAWLQGSPVLPAAALAPLVLMAFWLLRVRVSRRFAAAAAAS